jgi:hypothetical protein
MYTATLVLWAFAVTPDSSPSPSTVPFTVAEVDMQRSDDSTELTAYDPDGEVAGEVFMWVDPEGRVRLDALFADGLYMSVITDGSKVTIDTEDADEVAARMLEIDAGLDETAGLPKWFPCAAEAVLAVGACASLHVVACGATTLLAGCACLELATDEEYTCYQ